VTGVSSLLDPKTIDGKVLLANLETMVGLPAESFERGMGKVDGGL